MTLGLNLLTHPLLYLTVVTFGPPSVVPGELMVMAVEGAALAAWVPALTRPRGLAWAVAANLVSWQGGTRLLAWLAAV